MKNINETLAKTNIQAFLAVLIVSSGFYILAFQQSNSDVKIAVVGLMSSVIGYYFGSSRSTAKKDETIANQLNKE